MKSHRLLLLCLQISLIPGCKTMPGAGSEISAKPISATTRKTLIAQGHVGITGWTPKDSAAFSLRTPPATKLLPKNTQPNPKTGVIEQIVCDFYDWTEEKEDILNDAEELLVDLGHFPGGDPSEAQVLEKIRSSYKSIPELQNILREEGPGGRTPKFKCTLANGNVVKIKYDSRHINKKLQSNAEVYGEVIATRVLHGAGFYADKVYSVAQLVCHNCPKEPWTYSRNFFGILDQQDEAMRFTDAGALLKPDILDETTMSRSTLTLTPTIIEIKNTDEGFAKIPGFRGKDETAGWGFDELYQARKKPFNVEERIAREALTILVSFLNHMDNKDEQQRLVCEYDPTFVKKMKEASRKKEFRKHYDKYLAKYIKEGMRKTPAKEKAKKKATKKAKKAAKKTAKTAQISKCISAPAKAILMVQDAGSNLGLGFSPIDGEIRLDKLNFEKWAKHNIWKRKCVVHVNTPEVPGLTALILRRIGIGLPSLTRKTVSGESVRYLADRMRGFLQKDARGRYKKLEDLFHAAQILHAPDLNTKNDQSRNWANAFAKKLSDQIVNYSGCNNKYQR